MESKEAFAKHVVNLKDEGERRQALLGLKPTLEICLKRLGVI